MNPIHGQQHCELDAKLGNWTSAIARAQLQEQGRLATHLRDETPSVVSRPTRARFFSLAHRPVFARTMRKTSLWWRTAMR